MNDANPTSSPDAPGVPLPYPINQVIGALTPTTVGAAVVDLIEAGFGPIGILAGEAGVKRMHATANPPGFFGHFTRFSRTMGYNQEFIERFEQELQGGRALVGVEVDGNDAKHLARDILGRHGGRSITHIGKGTIETLMSRDRTEPH